MRAGTCRGKKGLPHCGEKGVGAGMMREIPLDGLGCQADGASLIAIVNHVFLSRGMCWLVVVGFRGMVYWTFMR